MGGWTKGEKGLSVCGLMGGLTLGEFLQRMRKMGVEKEKYLGFLNM
jgi:hypothetical protein